MTVFDDLGEKATFAPTTYIDCADRPAPSSIYRVLAAVTTSSTQSSSTSRTEASTPTETSINQTSTPASTSTRSGTGAPGPAQVSTTQSSSPSAQEATTSPSSNAWIAGPVIGGVVAVLLMVALALWAAQIRQSRRSAAGGQQRGGGSALGGSDSSPIAESSEAHGAHPYGGNHHFGTSFSPAELRGGGLTPTTPQELIGWPIRPPMATTTNLITNGGYGDVANSASSASPPLNEGYEESSVWVSPPPDARGASVWVSPPANGGHGGGGSAWLSPHLDQDRGRGGGNSWHRGSAIAVSELSAA